MQDFHTGPELLSHPMGRTRENTAAASQLTQPRRQSALLSVQSDFGTVFEELCALRFLLC